MLDLQAAVAEERRRDLLLAAEDTRLAAAAAPPAALRLRWGLRLVALGERLSGDIDRAQNCDPVPAKGGAGWNSF